MNASFDSNMCHEAPQKRQRSKGSLEREESTAKHRRHFRGKKKTHLGVPEARKKTSAAKNTRKSVESLSHSAVVGEVATLEKEALHSY